MARGSGRAPGRPKADPAQEAARQAAYREQQTPLEAPAPEPVATSVGPPALAELAEPAAPSPAADPVAAQAAAPLTAAPQPAMVMDAPPAAQVTATAVPPAVPTGVQTLSPVAPDPVAVPLPAPELDATGTPTSVRDLYVVPVGCLDPADDPHRPPADTCVLVTTDDQIVASGAWMPLPGGTRIATTRDVQRVYWAMGSISPSYAIVVPAGVSLPRPAELEAAVGAA